MHGWLIFTVFFLFLVTTESCRKAEKMLMECESRKPNVENIITIATAHLKDKNHPFYDDITGLRHTLVERWEAHQGRVRECVRTLTEAVNILKVSNFRKLSYCKKADTMVF